MPARKDTGSGNDLTFSCREATNDSFYAKVTSRAIWPVLRFHRPTGRASFVNESFVNERQFVNEILVNDR